MKAKDEPRLVSLPIVGETLTVTRVENFHDKVHGHRVFVTLVDNAGTKMLLEVVPAGKP